MAELFGYTITRAKGKGSGDQFIAPSSDDGTIEVWLKYAKELKAGKIFKQMVDETIERNKNNKD